MTTLPEIFNILAQAAPAQPAPNPIGQFLPLIFIVVIFYFLLIRPQQKQRKQHQALVNALKTGDKVVTSAGIHGIIANVKDNVVSVKIADNVKIDMDKSSVTHVVKPSGEKEA